MSSHKQTLGRALHEALGPGPGSDRQLAQRARLIEWEERRRRSPWERLLGGVGFGGQGGAWFTQPRAWLALGLCGALTALALFWSVGSTERSPLVATVDGAALQENAWVTAVSHAETLSFSEGSHIAITEGGRARVSKLDQQGLRMTLESGKLEASITPKTGYRWVVQAGPHTVTVLGTVFSVEWSAEHQRLNVAVERGRVQVESAETLDNPRVLVAGESFSVAPALASAHTAAPRDVVPAQSASAEPVPAEPTAEAVASNVEAQAALRSHGRNPATAPKYDPALPAAGSNSAGSNPAGSDKLHGASEGTAAVASAGEGALTWQALADAGRYADAVSAARNIGVGTLLGSTGATDLMLLADAARLGKAPDLAQQALLTIRERFPSHPNATVAAFQLGRLAFEVKHDDRAAVRWFQAYLDATPGGSMAEGARGRLLRAWLRLGDRAKARAAAVEYLKHHPHGHHASVAQSLLGE